MIPTLQSLISPYLGAGFAVINWFYQISTEPRRWMEDE